jgi:prephenate dehydrogenase
VTPDRPGDSPLFDTVALFGIGLLGGSLGLALQKRGLARHVIGIGRSEAAMEDAVELGLVHEATTDLDKGFARANLVILCTPVRHILQVLPQVVHRVPSGCIITDVGSTKASIVARGNELTRGTGRIFVGSHPMAGSEKSGMRFSRADLYQKSTCFVTKTPETDLHAFAKICALWTALGSRVVITRPERHDRLVAIVSHLPHMAAVALVRAVAATEEDKNLVRGIIGNGFRDTTRIAASSSAMWEDICADNAAEIRSFAEAFSRELEAVMAHCNADGTIMKDILEEASDYRESLDQR